MIISQTPLRISFFGGGTDIPSYYRKYGDGCVLSSAIDKYIFVIVKKRYDRMIRVGYTKTELVNDVNEIQHELVREALRLAGINSQIEIGTLSDIPASGSGLGSSSAVTVGALNALFTYKNDPQPLEKLADWACKIEIEILEKPIGKQDQYITALGGLRYIRFFSDGKVVVERIAISDLDFRLLNQQLMLFYTNISRRAEDVLEEQNSKIEQNAGALSELKDLAYEAKALLQTGDFDAFGRLLDHGWKVKKGLASRISTPKIDELYETAKKAGALGGKVTGAGGGGFLLLYCPRESQQKVREALKNYPELSFHLEPEGSKIIFNHRQ